ncbi:MAG: DUF3592 domain-containing protein [Verrucomicrobiales bacterium]|jgi:hypothetical protein|nr:DUF3592 domain-containing protein [Verrucomicrobiales bacterium]
MTSSNPPSWMPLILIFVGIVFTIFMGRPVVDVLRAKNWLEVPCTVLSATVESDTNNKDSNNTYSIKVRYTYSIDGKNFTGERYQFMFGYSIGYHNKATVVKNLPPGKRVTCFVNPSNPKESVIRRGLTPDMVVIFIPLGVLSLGIFTLISRNKLSSRHQPDIKTDGPRKTPSQRIPLLPLCTFAVIWNIFCYQIWLDDKWGVIPFAIVAVLLNIACIYLIAKFFSSGLN